MAIVAQLVRALDCGSRCRGFESRRSPNFTPPTHMTTIEALILGLIQGLTEFLPVSSSGHLELAQYFLGMQNLQNYVIFDLVCHLGTLVAIFLMFRLDIQQLFSSDKTRLKQVILGTLPLFPLVLIIKPIKALFDQPQYLGYFFILTALLLYLGTKFSLNKPPEMLQKSKWRDSLTIGCFQALAILPGVSRSGSTISAARVLGWSVQDAIAFSFLLAIPAILGGTVVELMQVLIKKQALPSIGFSQYALGFTSSFGMGYCALSLLRSLAAKKKFVYFAWYCLLLGIFTTLYFLMH